MRLIYATRNSFAGIVFSLILIAMPELPASAQDQPDWKAIVQRLERLERENEALRQEVRGLREELHPVGNPDTLERLAVQESRTAEQAQTKVESSQRFPITLTGMALFNAFLNSKENGGIDYPTIASLGRGSATGGATLRQTVIGLEYSGPQTFLGGAVRGSLYMDFLGGTGFPNNQLFRLRTAAIAIDWGSRTVMLGQDKPIFSPRSPDSLAQAVAPLSGSGNLWFWEPQARFEQRMKLGEEWTLRAQAGVVQTSEFLANVPASAAGTLERYRPGAEGRFEVAYHSQSGRRIEIAPGFHYSASHVAGVSVPSNILSVDWLLVPKRWLEFKGAAYSGENLAHFGLGGARQGFTVTGPRNALPVRGRGGWSQLGLRANSRLTFHFMAGLHTSVARDLVAGDIGANRSYGGNLYYRLAPNVIVSFEGMQTRTTYSGVGLRWNNHYDLALAYLF
ncbi:MAG: hypothetical protein HY820_29615 [Acidobacteria bacterium]|nr:hypothetical protein [Acidobacteriota bacterium]